MENDEILKELLALSKESASNDAEIKVEIKAMQKRLDKQDEILGTLTNTVSKQQGIQEEMLRLKEKQATDERKIGELEVRVLVLENAPQKKELKQWQFIKGTGGKIMWLVVSGLVGAGVSGLIGLISILARR